MKKIQLTESEFMRVIKNSVKRTLKEDYHFGNFSADMDEDGTPDVYEEDENSTVLDILKAREGDYDMLNYPEVEEISIEELAQCIEDILDQTENGGPITASVGHNTITITDDTLYLENEDNGEESQEQWAGAITSLVSGDDMSENLDYIVDTIASSINQCWFDTHEDELGEDEDFSDENFEDEF